jgi:hypothetical protein
LCCRCALVKMEEIKETIKKLLGDLEAKKKGAFLDGPENLLKKVLAKQALEHIKLYTLRNGVLNIKVDSSTWLYYLSMQKTELLKKMRELSDNVKEIRFSLGE